MIDKLISVVISCYNYGPYMPFAMNFPLKQDYQNLEIIVVNDWSNNNTEDFIAPYLSSARIKHIKKQNAGNTSA